MTHPVGSAYGRGPDELEFQLEPMPDHLDAESWRHYLPALGSFAIHHLSTNNPAVEALIASLRPPDREPPRLGSLDSVQERLICQLLEVLAYSAESVWQAEACQALEEWWIDGALYRP